jgi:hypothetical protein
MGATRTLGDPAGRFEDQRDTAGGAGKSVALGLQLLQLWVWGQGIGQGFGTWHPAQPFWWLIAQGDHACCHLFADPGTWMLGGARTAVQHLLVARLTFLPSPAPCFHPPKRHLQG